MQRVKHGGGAGSGSVPRAGSRLRLTPLQEAFCHIYLGEANRNGTKAARLAGYRGDDRTLAVAASKLLRSGKVLAYKEAELDRLTSSTSTLLKLMGDDAVGIGESVEIVDRLESGARGERTCMTRVPTVDWEAVVRAGKAHLLREIGVTATGLEFRWADPQPARVALLRLRMDIAERQAKHTMAKRTADGTVETTTVEGVTAHGAASIFTIGAVADTLEAAVEEVCGRGDHGDEDETGAPE